jgi:hypothetical protein
MPHIQVHSYISLGVFETGSSPRLHFRAIGISMNTVMRLVVRQREKGDETVPPVTLSPEDLEFVITTLQRYW